MFFLQELALRIRDVFQREGLGQQRVYLTALDVADEVGKYGLVPRSAADQRQVFEIKATPIEGDHRTADYVSLRHHGIDGQGPLTQPDLAES